MSRVVVRQHVAGDYFKCVGFVGRLLSFFVGWRATLMSYRAVWWGGKSTLFFMLLQMTTTSEGRQKF